MGITAGSLYFNVYGGVDTGEVEMVKLAGLNGSCFCGVTLVKIDPVSPGACI